MKEDTKIEQELAWIGDAVLGLFARKWILEMEKKINAKMFTRMTSNIFLNGFGNPTKVEAEIGLIFNNEGLEKAFYDVLYRVLFSKIINVLVLRPLVGTLRELMAMIQWQ